MVILIFLNQQEVRFNISKLLFNYLKILWFLLASYKNKIQKTRSQKRGIPWFYLLLCFYWKSEQTTEIKVLIELISHFLDLSIRYKLRNMFHLLYSLWKEMNYKLPPFVLQFYCFFCFYSIAEKRGREIREDSLKDDTMYPSEKH